MPKKLNLAVFASTKGSDLQAIIDALAIKEITEVDLKFVLSNKKDCYALERARQAGYKTIFVNPKNKTRQEFDQECLAICRTEQIDLIMLIGYMRLISKTLLDPYRNKIFNIHPSLLPKYPGMDLDVHKDVLDNHETETGCTLHFVDEGMDTGPIIIQEKILIAPSETAETLKIKVQNLEQKVIIRGLKLFAAGKIIASKTKVKIKA